MTGAFKRRIGGTTFRRFIKIMRNTIGKEQMSENSIINRWQ